LELPTANSIFRILSADYTDFQKRRRFEPQRRKDRKEKRKGSGEAFSALCVPLRLCGKSSKP
jgi:hypothetical protein